MVLHQGYALATLHSADEKTGVIAVLEWTRRSLTLRAKKQCASFPHGIDVHDGKVAYTSYTDSSFTILPLEEVLAGD